MKPRNDPATCRHPDTALGYNHGSWSAAVPGAIPGQPGMYCKACQTCVRPVSDILDFIRQRQDKWLVEHDRLTIPILDPFGVAIDQGSRVCFPQVKRKIGWGIVEDINHGKPPIPRDEASIPRVTAPKQLKIRPTDDELDWSPWSWELRKDGKRKSYGLGIHVAPWAVVVS